ncbi:ABC-type branched-chain amino acid transport system, periplasmic component [Hyella patelloides LEGE 07179]|uniref:non-specific serine/threonine protein kinase n=1 Tax=Hyella patelloides LEGE 07179 TaxID=945734 RepID=A0A563VUH9_9CYAN|nr:bifunctional serine/threonine-protein kinase/ABC transporter substrate-binding protein [Hyella patelloides]VEP15063.1 ABC-type branched-chain amino acid transport system, periplasmic component [Hyella patelloides LEGE 07179]
MAVLQPNNLLDGRYRIVSHLAEGGFGYTYLAEDTRRPSCPKCFVKQLKPDISNSGMLDDVRRLFRTEAETLEKLGEHPQIPRLLAYFEKDGEFYLVQELIKGDTLRDELKLGEPWSEKQICQMLVEVLEILDFVHENQVIHRDVKPDNIIRRYEDKRLALVDFGSVKQIRGYESQIMGTVVVGTRGYMPTEQGRGSPRYNSDLYALGMIAIQSATGLNINQFPEDSETGEIIWQPWARDLSDGLASILSKMVRHHFGDRYQSSQEVLQELEKNTPLVDKTPYIEQKITSLKLGVNHFTHFSTAWDAAKRKLFITLPLALIITLFGLISWFLTEKSQETQVSEQLSVSSEVDINPNTTFISSGTTALIKPKETEQTGKYQAFQLAKQQGIKAMETGDYLLAVNFFEQALQQYRNAPETRIYRNNARSQVQNQKTYTIAVAVPISLDLEAAEAMLRGVAQAQDEINQAGGINGIPLRVVIANDGDDLEMAKNIASELGQNKEVLGVVGHYYSSRTLATGKTYEDNQLVAIALSSSTEIENFSDYVFRTSPSDKLTAQALAHHMLTKWEKNKVAIFYDPNSKYSMSLRKEFVRAVNFLGGQVVMQSDWSIDNFNVNHEVAKAIDREAEVMMLMPDNAVQIRLGIKVAQISKQRLKLLGGDVMYSPKTLEFGAENVLDMVIGAFWHIDADPDSKFSLKSKRLWGAEVNWISAMAYDATQALIQALSLQSNPNRIGMQQVLSKSDFSASGASNPVSFLSSGNRAQAKIQLVEIIKDRESKTGYGFDPIAD